LVRNPVLQLHDVRLQLADRVLLNGVDLTVAEGESVALMGPSGSGKSSLLSCVLGLMNPDSGTIEVAGANVTSLRAGARARHRSRHIGMVFQFGELLPELTALENVMLAAMLGGVRRSRGRSAAEELLRDLGISDTSVTTGSLSGGERQRVAIARALVNKPSLILADEPTGALDDDNRDRVSQLLYSLPSRWGCGLLLVTHDQDVAVGAERVARITDGQISMGAQTWGV
jgi:putative ABC transport system ATP-binding protein/lipoprotein-releasing system ATP-binding protein